MLFGMPLVFDWVDRLSECLVYSLVSLPSGMNAGAGMAGKTGMMTGAKNFLMGGGNR